MFAPSVIHKHSTHTMNQPTRDNIDVAILSGRMTSVEAFEAVKHPDSKAYILKYHMDEELEMHLARHTDEA